MVKKNIKTLDVVEFTDEHGISHHWLCVLLEYNKNGYEHLGYTDNNGKGIQLMMEDGTIIFISHDQKFKMSANDLPENAKIIGRINTYEYGKFYAKEKNKIA